MKTINSPKSLYAVTSYTFLSHKYAVLKGMSSLAFISIFLYPHNNKPFLILEFY